MQSALKNIILAPLLDALTDADCTCARQDQVQRSDLLHDFTSSIARLFPVRSTMNRPVCFGKCNQLPTLGDGGHEFRILRHAVAATNLAVNGNLDRLVGLE